MTKPKITGRAPSQPPVADKTQPRGEQPPPEQERKSSVDETQILGVEHLKPPARKAQLGLDYDEDGFPCLTAEQLSAWNVAHLEQENATLKRERAVLARQLWLEQQAVYRKLSTDIDTATNEHESRIKAYRSIVRDISIKLGFDLERCVVCDKTGRITFLDVNQRPLLGRKLPPDDMRFVREKGS